MTEAEKLEECRKFIRDWAYAGCNGSPFTEKQAQTLQSHIANSAWEAYKRIFGKTP